MMKSFWNFQKSITGKNKTKKIRRSVLRLESLEDRQMLNATNPMEPSANSAEIVASVAADSIDSEALRTQMQTLINVDKANGEQPLSVSANPADDNVQITSAASKVKQGQTYLINVKNLNSAWGNAGSMILTINSVDSSAATSGVVSLKEGYKLVGVSQAVSYNKKATISYSGNNITISYKQCDAGYTTFLNGLSGKYPTQYVKIVLNTSTKVAQYSMTSFGTSSDNYQLNAQKPSAPSSVSMSTKGVVSWSSVSGATKYTIDYKLQNSLVWNNATINATGTSCNISSALKSGNSYYIRVNAVNGIGMSSYKATTSAVKYSTTTPTNPTSKPSAPSSVSMSTKGIVSWSSVSAATSYSVQYRLSTSSSWSTANSSTTGTSLNISSKLTSGNSYYVRVAAKNTAGTSAYKATTSAVKYSTSTTTPTSKPSAPSSVSMSTKGIVSWSSVSAATSYSVQYRLSTSSSWSTANSSTTGTSLNISSKLKAGSSYYVRVAAKNTAGTSAYRATTSAVKYSLNNWSIAGLAENSAKLDAGVDSDIKNNVDQGSLDDVYENYAPSFFEMDDDCVRKIIGIDY